MKLSGTADLGMIVLMTQLSGPGCQSSTASAQDKAWPNEPAGFQVINDYGFDDPIPIGSSLPVDASGWFINNGGMATRVTDGSARKSPPNVMMISYPKGFTGGVAPATMWYNFTGPWPTELYIGVWLKVSNPWQGHSSGVNKIGFVTSGGTQHYALMPVLHGSAAPYYLDQQIAETNAPENPAYGGWLSQNVANPPFTLGVWHRVEMYLKYGTTSTSYNGIMKQWLDGTLVMSYSDINYADDGIDGWKIDPTWGGTGDTKTENDYYEIDHVHTSRR